MLWVSLYQARVLLAWQGPRANRCNGSLLVRMIDTQRLEHGHHVWLWWPHAETKGGSHKIMFLT